MFNPYDLDADELARPGTLLRCACCGDQFDARDFASTAPDSLIAALVAAYGGPVCDYCTDSHMLCDDCDAPVDPDSLSACFDGAGVCETCATPERIDPLGARVDNAMEMNA